jgi:hypothetical protein
VDADVVDAMALSTYMVNASIAITFDLYWHLMPSAEDAAAHLVDAHLERADTGPRLASLAEGDGYRTNGRMAAYREIQRSTRSLAPIRAALSASPKSHVSKV